MLFVVFPLLLLIFCLVFNFHQFDQSVSWCVPPWVLLPRTLCFLDLIDYFLSHVWDVFSYHLFRCFPRSFLFLSVPLLLSHCSFLFVFGHAVSFFGGFQHPPVGCSTASCSFGAFMGGDTCTSFYSPILKWNLFSFLFSISLISALIVYYFFLCVTFAFSLFFFSCYNLKL